MSVLHTFKLKIIDVMLNIQRCQSSTNNQIDLIHNPNLLDYCWRGRGYVTILPGATVRVILQSDWVLKSESVFIQVANTGPRERR